MKVTQWKAPKWAVASRNWLKRNSTVAASSHMDQKFWHVVGRSENANCSSSLCSRKSPESIGQKQYNMSGRRAKSISCRKLPLIGCILLRRRSYILQFHITINVSTFTFVHYFMFEKLYLTGTILDKVVQCNEYAAYVGWSQQRFWPVCADWPNAGAIRTIRWLNMFRGWE